MHASGFVLAGIILSTESILACMIRFSSWLVLTYLQNPIYLPTPSWHASRQVLTYLQNPIYLPTTSWQASRQVLTYLQNPIYLPTTSWQASRQILTYLQNPSWCVYYGFLPDWYDTSLSYGRADLTDAPPVGKTTQILSSHKFL